MSEIDQSAPYRPSCKHEQIGTSCAGRGGRLAQACYHVTVKDGVVTDCELDGGGPGDRRDPNMSLPVETLFSWVSGVHPFTNVQFHPEWHVPETVVFEEPGMADEEYIIRLLAFEMLD